MQDIPRDIPGLNDIEDQDAELDDLDEDENRDVRKSQRQQDKQIARDDEFSDSDDDDDDDAIGLDLSRQDLPGKRRNMMDFQNPMAVPDDQPLNGSPAPPPADATDDKGDDDAPGEGEVDAGSDVSQAGDPDDDIHVIDADMTNPVETTHAEQRLDASPAEAVPLEDVEMEEAEKDAGRAERIEEDEAGEARAEAAS